MMSKIALKGGLWFCGVDEDGVVPVAPSTGIEEPAGEDDGALGVSCGSCATGEGNVASALSDIVVGLTVEKLGGGSVEMVVEGEGDVVDSADAVCEQGGSASDTLVCCIVVKRGRVPWIEAYFALYDFAAGD